MQGKERVAKTDRGGRSPSLAQTAAPSGEDAEVEHGWGGFEVEHPPASMDGGGRGRRACSAGEKRRMEEFVSSGRFCAAALGLRGPHSM